MREDQQRFPVKKQTTLLLFINDLPHQQGYIVILNKQTSPIIKYSWVSATCAVFKLLMSVSRRAIWMTDHTYRTTEALYSSGETRARRSILLFSSLLFSSLLFSSLLFSLSLALEGCEDERSRLETGRKFFSSRSTALSREGVKKSLTSSPLIRGLSAPLASPPAHGNHDFTSALWPSGPCLCLCWTRSNQQV